MTRILSSSPVCAPPVIALCAVWLLAGCGPTETNRNRPDAAQASVIDAAAADATHTSDASTTDAGTAVDAPLGADAAQSDAAQSDAAQSDAAQSDAAQSDAAQSDAAAPPYTHTIAIDGVNDFVTADERFATSSAGYAAYVAWDSTYLYVGVDGADVAAASSTKWMLIYIGGAPGTATSVAYNTQHPALPFAAKYHIGWRTDNSVTQALRWNSTAWVDAAWDFTNDVFQTGTFVEMRIAFADIDSPSAVSLHVSMINEQDGVEGSFSAVPRGSFSDSYDPDYTRYLSFDVGGPTKPTAHPPLP